MIFKRKNPIIKQIKEVLLSNNFQGGYILSIHTSEDVIVLQLQIPAHKELSDLENILTNLKEELKATDFKIHETSGKRITILFGKRNLTNINYNNKYLHHNTLKIELPNAFGSSILDFSDGASCHLLNGGTTRMGKTCFLLYLSTVLYLQTSGNIQLYITSTKLKDYYPFEGLAHLSRTDTELMKVLNTLIDEYKERDNLLYSPELSKATDSKSVEQYYPHLKHHFKPIFLIIDEYARFSDNKPLQKLIMELVETAGYVNIHVVISTQRPDARTVLSPRIKSNLLARICFTTADENNSKVILDKGGAEKLGKIQGRAIFLDSDTNIVQVPYLTPEQCEELLNPFKKEIKPNDNPHKESNQRPTNNEVVNKIQNMFKESDSNDFI